MVLKLAGITVKVSTVVIIVLNAIKMGITLDDIVTSSMQDMY